MCCTLRPFRLHNTVKFSPLLCVNTVRVWPECHQKAVPYLLVGSRALTEGIDLSTGVLQGAAKVCTSLQLAGQQRGSMEKSRNRRGWGVWEAEKCLKTLAPLVEVQQISQGLPQMALLMSWWIWMSKSHTQFPVTPAEWSRVFRSKVSQHNPSSSPGM